MELQKWDFCCFYILLFSCALIKFVWREYVKKKKMFQALFRIFAHQFFRQWILRGDYVQNVRRLFDITFFFFFFKK